ncbi:ESPR domain-containing protein [Citrobacter freundii]|nr:ESPR domain-containing protein [Citrobacter freundii]WFZ86083.1 ESPR domain-containing protein [Citrobacter freundii]
MNKVYSIIWNAVLGIWVVVSELTKGKKKSSSRKTVAVLAASALSGASMLASAAPIIDTGEHNIYTDYQRGISAEVSEGIGNDSNLLIVFYVQIMPDDFVMQLHRF